MAQFVAVAEAVRLAEKQTTLLREVMKLRNEAADPIRSERSPPSSDKVGESQPPER